MERDRSRSISPGGEPDQKPDESSREEKNKKPEGEKKVVSDKAQEKARQQKEEEEKKKAEAEEKAAEEKAREELDEEEKREEEKEETEERDRKLTHLRQQILGVAAVGILTQSLQRLWRLLRWRRQLEIADDGRILTADGHVDLGRLAYAAQAEAEQSDAAATPGDQANQTDRSDEILAPAGVLPETVEQIADVQIPADPLADQAINSDDLRSQEDGEDSTGDETYTDEDFSGDLPDWAFDNLPNPEESPPENPLELDDVQPKRSKPAKEKASKPWNLFGDRDNSLRSPDQTKPPDKKPLDVQQKTKDESSSPNAEQPQKISESDAKKMTEKLLGKLNSEEAKILRESSGPSREFMAHLIREKLGVKVDLKGSDLDKIGRSLRQKLREPVDQISAPTSTSDGGPIGGDGVTPGSATPSGSGSGTGAASSTSSQVAGAPSGLGATAYSSDGSDFGSDEPFPLGGSNIQSNNVPGESAGVRRSRSGDGKEVDWSSLPPDDFGGGSPAISGSNRASSIGSPLSSSPSYSPEFGKPGSSSQRTSSPPGQGTSSSLAGSSVAGPAVSSAANRNPVTGGSSPSFSGFGPT
ncbi:hypothetical protein FWG95_01320 [Candidatus Saccharibacteria bacterium]|nr:hypothetical protein [Candidatus Saccharibacteria bacterium]